MGRLVDGEWVKGSIITSEENGGFDREPRTFRDCIGETHERYRPEAQRYHLYVSLACPWAHRTLIYRHLKGLRDIISVDIVHPHMLENGWSFSTDFQMTTGDSIFGKRYLYEVYQAAQPDINTNATVPILWDKHTNTIVNNESSEIIRIFNSAFNALTGNDEDFVPDDLRAEIDDINVAVYDNVNNGVYRAGFAKTQAAYDDAVVKLFDQLEWLEKHLADRTYLCGDRLTEADIRLITTLLRFDCVYVTHFKCNIKRMIDYPNLSRYIKDMYALDAVKNTTDFEHIKQHYYFSHHTLNPTRIVARGPNRLM